MNLGTKALQFLQTVAPTIATATLGPFGGMAVTALEQVFGVKSSDQKGMEAAMLNATPDQIVALQKANNDFQVQMKQLGVTEEQLQYGDVASARTREEIVRDWTPSVLAYTITIGFFGVLWYVIHFGVRVGQGQGGEAILLLLGGLSAAWTGIISYYFGSSIGARKGLEALSQIAKQP